MAQNGQEHLAFPDGLDCLFIGGDTDWKLSAHAESCIRRAQAMNLWTHVGRVNTKKRLYHFDFLGIDSADGTGPTFHPSDYKANLPRWLSKRSLFSSKLQHLKRGII